jgi:hypothetical protein
MERHIGVTTLWTTFCRRLKRMRGLERINRPLKIRTRFCRCLRRMPSFEGLLSHCRASFSKASPIKSNATSLSAPMQSAADIGLRVAYHAHSEKPSPIFSTRRRLFAGPHFRSRRQSESDSALCCQSERPGGTILALFEASALSITRVAWATASGLPMTLPDLDTLLPNDTVHLHVPRSIP